MKCINNKKPSRLLILGNGFDIHCGLDTKYSDFMKYLARPHDRRYNTWYRNVCNITDSYLHNFWNVIQNIIKHKTDYLKSKTNFRNSHFITKMFEKSFENNYLTFNDTKCNFWFGYFCLMGALNKYNNEKFPLKFKNQKTLKNWCDVEGQIEAFFDNYSLILAKYIDTYRRYYKDSEYIDNKKELNIQRNELQFNISRLIFRKYATDNKQKPNYTDAFMPAIIMYLLENSGYDPLDLKKEKRYLYDFLYDQLRKLEYCFKVFINTKNKLKDSKNKRKYNKCKDKAISVMTNGHKYTLLTFNYTDNTTHNCVAHKNVHSTIHKLPIFGIDTTNKANKPYYRFTKTYRIMRLANGDNQRNSKKVFDLAKGRKYIIFYGQSLAHADYSYFVAIFNHFQIYKMSSNINLVFYYTKFDGKEEKRQFSRIYRLMSHYGKKSHHPDLLHKMLLEDRLTIQKL